MPKPDDLASLVDTPEEILTVEYKAKIDIDDNVSRAKLAKHLAALCNYGGGHVVLGFDDNLIPASKTEFSEIDRDSVSRVVTSFLDPPFQCNVRSVTAKTGARHTVISVPCHGATPVCTKRDGPQDANRRPQGILSGCYYTRKPGPKSEAITSHSDWAPIIRRCALYERQLILGAIGAALEGGRPSESVDARLRHWHKTVAKRYGERMRSADRSEEAEHGYTQFSFSIHNGENPVEIPELAIAVEQCSRDAEAVIRSGWSPFVVLHVKNLSPRWRTDQEIDDNEYEFLEVSLIEDQDTIFKMTDLWRVARDGRGTLIQNWLEDTPHFLQGCNDKRPQAYLSPKWLAKSISGAVLYARALANKADGATAVSFRFEWCGLSGRHPFDSSGFGFRLGRTADDSTKIAKANVSLLDLNAAWESTAATLAQPVARSVGLEDSMNGQQFTKWAGEWKSGR
ncbi:helix-turn-helix domain-containing protein [Novosphingobium sp.]|uniref:AlbA family DNA-binding domain-containing protein n=1 Tax=Novosphingobium sp. TaxID=1874826 RepID=UPI003B517A49